MVDTMRKTVHWKLPVSPGMYRSLYKRDYQWCKEIKSPSEEDVQRMQIAGSQLKAKEFVISRVERAMPYGDSVTRERREVIPALTTKESYPPKYYPATDLAATQAEDSERLQALAEPENKLSYGQHLPAAAQTGGTAGILLCGQNLGPSCATYQHFILETYWASQRDAQQNRSVMLSSSVLGKECFDFDWRSTYNRDFQRWPGAHGGYCRGNKNFSHIFPKDDHLNQNHWVSEYKDSYSIFLWRLNQSSQHPAARLRSRLCAGSGIAMDTAQRVVLQVAMDVLPMLFHDYISLALQVVCEILSIRDPESLETSFLPNPLLCLSSVKCLVEIFLNTYY